MSKRTPLDLNALGLGPELEGPLPPNDLPPEKPVFSDFSFESEPKELEDDDPNRLTLFTKFGRRGGAKMGELEDVTPNDIFNNPGLLDADPGQWANYKNGCPFAASSYGMNAKGKGIALKCDGEWLNFLCRDPGHDHPEKLARTDKQGNTFWLWSIRNPKGVGYSGRKFPPFKRGDHVELAQAVITRLGDCAWDSGNRIRVFDSRFAPKGKGSNSASPTAGLWVEALEDDVMAYIRDLAGEWVVKGKGKFDHVTMNDSTVKGVYSQILSILRQGLKPGIGGPTSKFSDHPPRVVFKGSAWDVEKNQVVYAEKMRNMYCTNEEQLDVPYGGSDSPQQFLQFLREIWQDQPDLEDRILFLQEWMGMALAGKIVEVETHLLLQGTTNGMNGKSRLMTMIEGIFPKIQVSSLTFSDLSDKFRPAHLATSRLNIYADVRTEVVNSSKLKQVLSGDMILMERKGKDSIVGRPKAAWIVGVNDTFIPSEGDKALFRRWKVLTFDRRFTGDSAKTSLAEDILKEEKALIIYWALEGLKRWNKNKKFTEFSSAESSMCKWHLRVDSVEQWLEDLVVPLPEKKHSNFWIRREAHYEAYSAWAKRSGYTPVSLRRFGEAIKEKGLASARISRDGKQVWVHQLRLAEEDGSSISPRIINLDLDN